MAMNDSAKIELVRGDDEAIELEFLNEADNTPIDLTGSTVMFTVRANKDEADDTNALIKKDVTSHIDPTHGKTVVELSHTETTVAVGNYNYDLQIKDTAGKIKTIVIAEASIIQDVTKRN